MLASRPFGVPGPLSDCSHAIGRERIARDSQNPGRLPKQGRFRGLRARRYAVRNSMSSARAEVLEQRLSPERLRSYREATAGDLARAIELYEWNCAISAALLEVLGDVEVIVRNALHDSLTVWHARSPLGGEWYDNAHGQLSAPAVFQIAAARERLEKRRKAPSPGAMVAELNFGFWRYLLTKKYSSTLWPVVGRAAFPNMDHQRPQSLWARMGRLNDLRNRIAHHEPIHWRHIDRDLTDCLMAIRAVCLQAEEWSRDRARVLRLLALRPVTTFPTACRRRGSDP
jgi:hypothetical protein